MGWLIETWLVHKDEENHKEYFTGNMREVTSEAEAEKEATEEADRIGEALGLVVSKQTHHRAGARPVVSFLIGDHIEIRCREHVRTAPK